MNITRLPGMITDIQLGKRSLDVIAQHQAEVLGAEEGEPLFFLTSAGAVVVHDFYNTIEKTFCQIAEEIDGGLPQGDAWYQRLLQRMTVAIPAYRPAVIDQTLAGRLGEYLRFRHLFRHIYGFELDWARIRPLLVDLPAVLAEFIRQIDDFVRYLQSIQHD